MLPAKPNGKRQVHESVRTQVTDEQGKARGTVGGGAEGPGALLESSRAQEGEDEDGQVAKGSSTQVMVASCHPPAPRSQVARHRGPDTSGSVNCPVWKKLPLPVNSSSSSRAGREGRLHRSIARTARC